MAVPGYREKNSPETNLQVRPSPSPSHLYLDNFPKQIQVISVLYPQ